MIAADTLLHLAYLVGWLKKPLFKDTRVYNAFRLLYWLIALGIALSL